MNGWMLRVGVGLVTMSTWAVAQTDTQRETNTPRLIQTTVKPAQDQLPDDGASFCVPSSTTMIMYYLAAEGYSRLAPGWDPNDPASFNTAEALNVDRVLAGLMSTSPYAGTDPGEWLTGAQTYLGLKGYSSATVEVVAGPELGGIKDSITNTDDETRAAVMLLTWYGPAGNKESGHALALVGATDSTVTLHNPEPAALIGGERDVPANAQQTFNLVTEDPPLPEGLFLETPDNPLDRFALIGHLLEIRLNNDAKTGGAHGDPEDFHIDGSLTIGTNGGELRAEASLRDEVGGSPGGIQKVADGLLTLAGGENTTTGAYAVLGGTLEGLLSNASSDTAATPFGTGGMTIGSGAELAVRPRAAFGDAANLSIASGSGNSLNVSGGLGVLTVDPGTNTSLALVLGGNTDGTTANVGIGAHSSLLIAAPLDKLGAAVKITAAGTAGNVPSLLNGKMVSPAIGGRGSEGRLAFLSYDEATGFEEATTASDFGAAGDLVKISAAGKTISEAEAALSLIAHGTIDGTSSITLGQGGAPAGLILNEGAGINVADLIFSGDGYIYGGGSETSTITSDVTASEAVMLAQTGTGLLKLTGAVTASPEGVFVNKGNVSVADVAAGVTVNGGGRLIAEGTISGAVNVLSEGTLILQGGTLTGGLTMAANPAPFENTTWVPGGSIEGTGTVHLTSATTAIALNGIIGSESAAGALSFLNDVEGAEITINAPLMFTLTTLTSNGTGAAGVDWSSLAFAGDEAELTGAVNIQVNFVDESVAPMGGDAFWEVGRSWDFVTFGSEITLAEALSWRVADGNIFQFSSLGTFTLEVEGDTGILVWAPTPVPEPATWMLGAMGAVVLLGAAVRRRSGHESGLAG